MTNCFACDLVSGKKELLGGRIAETRHWIVEHCVGPLGVGTLIVKPRRHVLHVHELSDVEAAEMGTLLKESAHVVTTITQCDRVYVSLWSHPGWTPVHIHYVVQPIFQSMRGEYSNCGPTLQSEMFLANRPLPEEAVVEFCERAKRIFRGGA